MSKLKNSVKPCSILNLDSGYVKKLKIIVEQNDKVAAQRGVVELTEKIWYGYEADRLMFSEASFNMLRNLVESFEMWYNKTKKPDELVRMQDNFRVQQEKKVKELKETVEQDIIDTTGDSVSEKKEKWNKIPTSVDLRGIVWRHLLKLVNNPLGEDVTGLKMSLGRACAKGHNVMGISEREQYIIGDFLLSLFMQNGKEWFQFKIEKKRDVQQSFIAPTEKTLKWFLENNYLDIIEMPLLLPLDKMPDDLLCYYDSVYDEKNGKNTYLHKTEVKTDIVEKVLKRFSGVGLKINKKLLEWLIVNDDMLLTYKADGDNDKEKLKANAEYFNQRSILGVADIYSNVGEFYLPMFYDWRTRLYAVTKYLNYQGGKLALGLLMFSKGKKVTDSGLNYLKLYGCVLYGIKRASRDDMIKWVDEHTDKIVQMDKTFILYAKEPFLFAAFCLEYRDYLENPENFVSHFPILLDCTCSGLQHLSAITQDFVLAKKVNLTDSLEPYDIYSSMAILLENALCMDPEYRGIKINRAFVKRPIMTIAYSATLEGLTDQLLTFFTYNQEEKKFCKIDQPSVKLTKQQIRFLSKKMLELLYSEHPTLKNLLNYLQSITKCMSDLDLPVVWTTPIGVNITQKYNERIHYTIKNTSYKWLKTIALPIGTKNIDKRKQCLGVMPNMVHSLDASNIYTLASYLNSELPLFTIHDCFAGLASDMKEIEREVKKAFVSLYCNENWISKFHDSNLSLVEALYKVDKDGIVITNDISSTKGKKIVFPKKPILGDFDVKEVLKASFMLN